LSDTHGPNALERMADLLLRDHARDHERPLSRRQMDRRGRRERPSRIGDPEPPSAHDAIADLRFIGELTPMPDRQRCVYSLWVEGSTVTDIADALGLTPPTACRDLRAALLKCWLMGPVPFGDFSRRTLYRPPAPQTTCRGGSRCEVCAAPLWDAGASTLCDAPECLSVVRARRALDRRRWARSDGRNRP
jgi:hypothetical protein